MASASPIHDKELEQYRNLLATPTEFKDGFGWSTVAGIFFCGLVMLPGSIYLGLMTGGNMGAAGTWVTVILFAQIARRALRTMSKQELVVLLHAATFMVAANAMFPGGPFANLVYRAFLVTSEAARDANMQGSFPSWYSPPPDSAAIAERTLFHRDWIVPILLLFFMSIIGFVRRYTLGYFFFRLTSDVENLPFPLAPIAAQGAMAMAEMDESDGQSPAAKEAEEKAKGSESASDTDRLATGKSFKRKGSQRWRLFSLGATIGLAFGFLQVGIPAISGLFLESPIFIIPQPFIDTTVFTEGLLPATPTGIALDLGVILLGMVLPFWAVMGSFIAIALTMIMNPILHGAEVLTKWQNGMDTVNTIFANRMDFWLSFSIGAGLGIAAVSVYSSIRDVRKKMKEYKGKRAETRRQGLAAVEGEESIWATPQVNRGDYPLWIAVIVYALTSVAVIVLCRMLVDVPVLFLVFFAFVYNPFISYVNARLLGIAGQNIDIPFIKETSFILSGAKGVEIWLAPIPIENYGGMAQAFRVNELTGVNFFSLIKADIVALPILFLLSFTFWAFIWKSGPIPSDAYPYAQIHWELASKENVLLFSSTFIPPGSSAEEVSILDSQFMREAVHPKVIGSGFFFTVIAFTLLSTFGLPVMLVYGFIRGLGQIPHIMVLEIIGALIGRYYFQKKFGTQNFLRMIPVVMAGYFTGVGLISMATIAMNLIQQAVSSAPF